MSATINSNSQIIRIDRMDLLNLSDLNSNQENYRELSKFINQAKSKADGFLTSCKGLTITGRSKSGYSLFFWVTPKNGVKVSCSTKTTVFVSLFCLKEPVSIVIGDSIPINYAFDEEITNRW